MSTNLEYRERGEREREREKKKEKVGRQTSEAKRSSTRKRAIARGKKQTKHFFGVTT